MKQSESSTPVSVPERLREVGMDPDVLDQALQQQPEPNPPQDVTDTGIEGSSFGDS